MLSEVNRLHENLKFTYEAEDPGGNISFLDTLLTHDGSRISSTWYMKPSNNGLPLNYHALAPIKYKRSVIRSFVHRIYNSCSNWSSFHCSMEKMKKILENNQYQSHFYEPIIHDTLEKIFVHKKKERNKRSGIITAVMKFDKV